LALAALALVVFGAYDSYPERNSKVDYVINVKWSNLTKE